jgi:hypothetical protein
VKKALVKRRWFWWVVDVYSNYELNTPVAYTLPERFLTKRAAKAAAMQVRFSE